jgi:osmotically-inducible protein OsmY
VRTDIQIQRDVIDELRWDPRIRATELGVAEHDGVVTLSGTVSSYAEKWAAERAAERVIGVKAVASEIVVELPTAHVHTDSEVAHRILDAFRWDVQVPDKKLQVIVAKGWVQLDGEVEWQFQKDAAARAVRNIIGVRGLTNSIKVAPLPVSAYDVRTRVTDALRRQSEEHARNILVQAADSVVTLKGRVPTFAERRAAEHAAWSAPGVREVHDEILVGA